MQDIKLIVSDLDGTIIPESQIISKEIIKAFKEAQNNGYQILIATGRHYAFIDKDLINSLNPDYMVTINGGAVVNKDGAVLNSTPIPEDIFNKLIAACIENDIALCFKFKELMVTYNEHERFVKHYIRDDKYAHLIIDGTKNRDYHKLHGLPLGIFIIDDHNHVDQLNGLFPNLKIAYSFKYGYDIFPKNVTKKTAVDFVLKKLNLTWENVIAFGDAGNDLDMLTHAGIGVAMGNAKDEVKKQCAYVTKSVDDLGVKEALIHFNII